MPIYHYPEKNIFKLDTSASSYIFRVGEGGYLLQLYYGSALNEHDVDYLTIREGHDSTVPNSPDVSDRRFSPDVAALEYPAFGTGDFRLPALKIKNGSGNSVTDLRYVSHEIYEGKEGIPGMPSTFAGPDDADTLVVTASDITGAVVRLYYTVYKHLPVITRRVSVTNSSLSPLILERVYSASVDFSHHELSLLHLWGCWGRERRAEAVPLPHGITSISSTRGASGHYHNPFAALLSQGAGEEHGEVYGFGLVYSGNFDISAELDAFGLTRIVCGINPCGFEWLLEPGETFYTPEAVMVYSENGLGGMSRAYHRLYRRHLCRSEWQNKPRPVIINNWEGTYFNFDDDKLVEIARAAAELGIDMLVMDDGWFGRRNDDTSSLGDWYVNEDKLKGGLPSLARRCREAGVSLGIWFEPEMVSADSELFRSHPEWCLHTEGRKMSIARHQYVLDLTRPEVCDYIVGFLSDILSCADIEYVKWDFNRNLTEVSSLSLPRERQGEVFHRYVLGLYSILERITSAFPHLLLEGCASGGGRYDPAMLYYFPQYWTSDDTDPIERLYIQYGTSLAYPAATMSCHVSASPNHQTGRVTPLETRGHVAMAGIFGYELDTSAMTESERELCRRQTAEYKALRHIVTDGELYRLIPPDGNVCAWEYVTEDKSEALVTFVCIKTKIHPVNFLRLAALDENRTYDVKINGKKSHRLLGSTLMRAGLNLTRSYRDAESVMIYLKAVD